jgi:hypothetical protein
VIPSNGRPRRAPRLAAVALCAGLLAGCGGSSGGEEAGGGAPTETTSVAVNLPADLPQKPACGLVTQAEVEAAIGARVSPGKQEVQPARSVCSFSLVSAVDQSVVIISTSSSGVPASFASSRASAQGPRDVGAGDEAFVVGPQALVRKGNTMVVVLVVVRGEGTQLSSAATRLAQAVGGRL